MTDDTKKPDDEANDEPSTDASDGDASERDASDAAAETAAETVTETAAETETAAKPKKLKKGKKADAAKAAAAEKVEVVDDSPEGRQLKEAQVAFEVGDYKTTRAIATKLAGHERPAIADGARDLLRRTNIDPAQMIFLAACLCALIGVAFYYLR